MSKLTSRQPSTWRPPSPSVSARATREERYVGAAVRGYFRKPYGPGWALVGDAGYNKDFITAQGINDAFRDAELCAAALDQAFSGTRSSRTRWPSTSRRATRTCIAMYELTAEFASLEPASAELQQVLGGRAREPDGDGRLRTGHRRDDVARGVLLGGERGAHPGRGCLKPETAGASQPASDVRWLARQCGASQALAWLPDGTPKACYATVSGRK